MSDQRLADFIRQKRSELKQSRLPLKDIRIIDLGAVMAAPYAATLLGDFGAEVIKVEPPETPDAIRFWAVVEGKYQPFWLAVSRNKLPITLNLKHAGGGRILRQLIEQSDVLFENMRPGTLDRLGFSAKHLWEINKGLIIGRISGFGQTGPYAHKPGFGTLAEAMSGFTQKNAQPGGPPTNPPLALADVVAGVHLALGVMIALREQKRGQGGGQEIDLALYEPMLNFMGPDFLLYMLTGEIIEPMGNESSFTAPRNSFLTKDEKWVALSASSQAPFERLMDLVAHPELKTTPGFRNNAERIQKESRNILNQVIGEWIRSKTLSEVLEECEKTGVTIGPVYNMRDIANDPHVQSRGSITQLCDPVTGKVFSIPEISIRLLQSPGKIRFPGLPMGAANEVVLQDLLGYSPAEIAGLKANGAI